MIALAILPFVVTAFFLYSAQRHADEADRRVARTLQVNALVDRYSVPSDLRALLRHRAGFSALLEKRAADRLDNKGATFFLSLPERERTLTT